MLPSVHRNPSNQREIAEHRFANAVANIALSVSMLALGYLGILGIQNVRFAYTIIDVTKGTFEFLIAISSIHILRKDFHKIKQTILRNVMDYKSFLKKGSLELVKFALFNLTIYRLYNIKLLPLLRASSTLFLGSSVLSHFSGETILEKLKSYWNYMLTRHGIYSIVRQDQERRELINQDELRRLKEERNALQTKVQAQTLELQQLERIRLMLQNDTIASQSSDSNSTPENLPDRIEAILEAQDQAQKHLKDASAQIETQAQELQQARSNETALTTKLNETREKESAFQTEIQAQTLELQKTQGQLNELNSILQKSIPELQSQDSSSEQIIRPERVRIILETQTQDLQTVRDKVAEQAQELQQLERIRLMLQNDIIDSQSSDSNSTPENLPDRIEAILEARNQAQKHLQDANTQIETQARELQETQRQLNELHSTLQESIPELQPQDNPDQIIRPERIEVILKTQKRELQEARTNETALTTELEEARKQAEAERKNLQTMIETQTQELQNTRERNVTLETELRETQGQLNELNSILQNSISDPQSSDSNSTPANLPERVRVVIEAQNQTQKHLKDANTQIETQARELQQARLNETALTTKLNETKEQAEAEKQDLQTKMETQTQELQIARDKVAEQTQDLQQLERIRSALQNDTIDSQSSDSNSTPANLPDRIEAILEARDQAQKHLQKVNAQIETQAQELRQAQVNADKAIERLDEVLSAIQNTGIDLQPSESSSEQPNLSDQITSALENKNQELQKAQNDRKVAEQQLGKITTALQEVIINPQLPESTPGSEHIRLVAQELQNTREREVALQTKVQAQAQELQQLEKIRLMLQNDTIDSQSSDSNSAPANLSERVRVVIEAQDQAQKHLQEVNAQIETQAQELQKAQNDRKVAEQQLSEITTALQEVIINPQLPESTPGPINPSEHIRLVAQELQIARDKVAEQAQDLQQLERIRSALQNDTIDSQSSDSNSTPANLPDRIEDILEARNQAQKHLQEVNAQIETQAQELQKAQNDRKVAEQQLSEITTALQEVSINPQLPESTPSPISPSEHIRLVARELQQTREQVESERNALQTKLQEAGFGSNSQDGSGTTILEQLTLVIETAKQKQALACQLEQARDDIRKEKDDVDSLRASKVQEEEAIFSILQRFGASPQPGGNLYQMLQALDKKVTEFQELTSELREEKANTAIISQTLKQTRNELESLRSQLEEIRANDAMTTLKQLESELEPIASELQGGSTQTPDSSSETPNPDKKDVLSQLRLVLDNRTKLSKQIQALSTERNTHIHKIASLTEDLQQAQNNLRSAEAKAHQEDNKVEHIETLGKQIKTLNRQVLSLQSNLESQKIENASSSQEIQRLGERIASLQKTNKTLEEKNNQNKRSFDQGKIEIEANLEEIRAEKAQLEGVNTQLQGFVKQYQIGSLKRTLENMFNHQLESNPSLKEQFEQLFPQTTESTRLLFGLDEGSSDFRSSSYQPTSNDSSSDTSEVTFVESDNEDASSQISSRRGSNSEELSFAIFRESVSKYLQSIKDNFHSDSKTHSSIRGNIDTVISLINEISSNINSDQEIFDEDDGKED